MPGLLGGGSSSQVSNIPYNAGGSGQGGTVYTPSNQPGADVNYQALVNSLMGQYNAGTTPSQANYTIGENLVNSLLNSPYFPGALNAAQGYGATEQGLADTAIGSAGQFAGNPALVQGLGSTNAGYASDVAGYAPSIANLAPQLLGYAPGISNLATQMLAYQPQLTAGVPALQGGAAQLLQTGYDPQGALYQQMQGQVAQNAAGANAAAGLGSSPYGAGLEDQALSNFGMNWQNQQLARQAQALSGAGGAYGQAGSLTGAAAALDPAAAGIYGQAASLYPSAANIYGQAASLYPQAGNLNSSAASLFGAAPNLASGLLNLGTAGVNAGIAGAGAPLSTQEGFYNQISPLLTSATNIGNQGINTQNILTNELANYLNLGRNASLASGQLGALGFGQQQQGLSNLGSGIGAVNSIFGNPLGLAGGNTGGGIFGSGGLFGSGGALGGLFGGGIDTSGAAAIMGLPASTGIGALNDAIMAAAL